MKNVKEYLAAIANDHIGILGVGDIIATKHGNGEIVASQLSEDEAGHVFSSYRVNLGGGVVKWVHRDDVIDVFYRRG